MSIDLEAETCYVRYLSYGNEEEQELKDLMKITPPPKTRQKESEPEVIVLSCAINILIPSCIG